ncbi:MAG: 2,3-bisphosphoglycerate-independent phosphoglycerate mutase, partial [Oscillospiraceae bacterium]
VKRIRSEKYDVIILNFANCDMVGHTGFFNAAEKAVEAVDKCAGLVIDEVLAKGGTVLLTADHGNADQMYDANGGPFTAHTTNPVPFLVAGQGDVKLRSGGVLADIAPTMLGVMGMAVPKEMTGKSIIE